MLLETDSQQRHERLETGPGARHGHVAVHFGKYILVYGGWNGSKTFHDKNPASTHEIWLYNIYTEQWRTYMTAKKTLPPALTGASAVVIAKYVYMFGGWLIKSGKPTNVLWKMTWTTNGDIVWSRIQLGKNHKTPSPRRGHAAWEYEEKLWIFGGSGYHSDKYLDEFGDFTNMDVTSLGCNNQLLCYNPASKEWTNLNCLGSVPEPCSDCATTFAKDKVWVFGGRDKTFTYFDDLYELNMHSFTWTQIQTDQTRPQGRCLGTLNLIFGSQLVLHCGSYGLNVPLDDTWIFDLPSQSWRQYKYSADHQRYGHTGISGIDRNIIIMGGESAYNPVYKFTLHLKLRPKTLQQLAMRTVCKHKTELEWKCLPKKLIAQLELSETVDELDNKPVH